MKKTYFFLTLLLSLLLPVFSYAQLDKKSWLVGGNLGFQSANSKSSFYLNPNIGYFVANKVATGLVFSYYNSSGNFLSAGPFMRGYIKMGKATLFGHTRFIYTSPGSGNGYVGFGAGPALGVFLNDYVALEGLLDYSIPDLGNTNFSTLGFHIGLQVYFPKK